MIKNLLIVVGAMLLLTNANAGLSMRAPDQKVQVTNFDKNWIYLKDSKGRNYKYPRKDFAHKKPKMHQKFSAYHAGLRKHAINKK